MFNFHKPRTFRSTEGCCICRAKSSSSRFTDSRKYERDIMQCFDLKYPRQGEICNACVLLVKRFKRLPVGSKRNWSHIVDAKAGVGPGYNKIQTKNRSERINSKAAVQQQQLNNTSPISTNGNNNNSTLNGAGSSSPNGLCYAPEKFSKIYKKSKKIKDTSSHNSKRKSNSNGWSQNNTHSLPTTLDLMDSDYEDTRAHASLSGNTCGTSVVQFQTQTRASAYKAQAAAEARMRVVKLGTKRRKCLPPRKYARSMQLEESLKFFDEKEWVKRNSCCGVLYENTDLGGAVIIDAADYKPCQIHTNNPITIDSKNNATFPLKNSIIQTIPAVVQLHPFQGPPSSSSVSSSMHTCTINATSNTFTTTSTTTASTPTPVLKKHHLFYKRQSECFPQGDAVAAKTNNNHTNSSAHNQQHQQQNNTILQRDMESTISSSSISNPQTTVLSDAITSLPLIISSTSSSPSLTVASSSANISAVPQMPKHSSAKVTTISPPLATSIQNQTHHTYTTNGNGTLSLTKPNSYLHKVKSDCSKITKNSLEKFNTGVRLKGGDISEIKPIMRTIDKSSPTQANCNSLNATTTGTAAYQSLPTCHNAGQSTVTTTSVSASSPTPSTSSTSSNKFSDNSSDSGFDENMLDRKSASPLQEDCEKKMLSRSGVQTMFLASGVQIQGQPQNLVLTGNEVAAKILQNRKYNNATSSPIAANSRSIVSNHHPTATAVKIAQISTIPHTLSSATNSVGPSMSSAAQAKMRAIYNNNNTIQHENGITTIVPASSLAASTQTAAMQNIAPSTVTITPAPPLGTQFNPQNVVSRKLTTANIISLQSNTTNLSNSHNNNNGNHIHHHLNSNHNTANQKIILLKTSNNINNNTATVTGSTNYNTLIGGQPLGNGTGGR